MLHMKQDTLARELGGDWTQKRISLLEQKEEIDPYILQHVADVMKMPVEAFKNYDEEATVMNIQNNYEGSNAGGTSMQCNGSSFENYIVNPIEKWLEAMEENKKLYERMLKDRDEVIARLEGLLKGK